MESITSLIVGIALVAVTATDLIYTAFAPRGSGIISGPVTFAVWRLFFYAGRLTKGRAALTGAGVVIVFTILMTWVLLLWAGNYFIYASDKAAVVSSTSHIPADNLERIYFTGYTLSTLGNGDFVPGTDGWKIYTAFISFTGLMFITIAITYMVPVLSAVTRRRALSIRIASIGSSPQRILLDNWDGTDFKKLEDQFQSLTSEIIHQGQMHLSYPVLHYFQHEDKEASLLPNLAALDEAITILLLYIPERLRPEDQYLVPLRKAITTFLDSITSLYINPDKSDVPALEAGELRQAQVPLLQPDMQAFGELSKRRRALKAMVEYNGWKWKEISAPVLNTEMDLPSML
ncbi:potassium channel family protein [Pontibacter russatus]|uniref:potassium channel family protein n=1 Tax=Pontibacter russatus TaxID=2694929 RepID=UPI00137B7ED5|nr:potassium channel family protein [Pontibacter russatus]